MFDEELIKTYLNWKNLYYKVKLRGLPEKINLGSLNTVCNYPGYSIFLAEMDVLFSATIAELDTTDKDIFLSRLQTRVKQAEAIIQRYFSNKFNQYFIWK